MTKRRRRFSRMGKADAVRKHIRAKVPVSQIADEMHIQPTLIRNWLNCVLSQAERAFESQKQVKPQSAKYSEQMAESQRRLNAKNAVIAEFAEQNMQSNIPNSPIDVSEKR